MPDGVCIPVRFVITDIERNAGEHSVTHRPIAAAIQPAGGHCRLAYLWALETPMEHTMRRFLLTGMIGLSLLAAGGAVASASAASPKAVHPTDRPMLQQVHYDHGPRFDRGRYWHRPAHRWQQQSRYDRPHNWYYRR